VSSSKRPKILLSRSFISDAKSSGLVVLPGPPGNTRARCPMVNFGAVHVPHRAQGLGGSLGHGSSRHGIESGSWTSAFLMPPACDPCKALMAPREPPILLREFHHALVGVFACAGATAADESWWLLGGYPATLTRSSRIAATRSGPILLVTYQRSRQPSG